MKKFFSKLFKNNLHILIVDIVIIYAAYNIILMYVKSAPVKSQTIDGIQYTLVSGYKYRDKKFYFQLTVKNISDSVKNFFIEKPYCEFIIEKEGKFFFNTYADTEYNDKEKNEIEPDEKIKFYVEHPISEIKLESGNYNLICRLLNKQRNQIQTEFTIRKSFYE